MKKLTKQAAIKTFPSGTRVRYSRDFLRSICDLSHSSASREGTVSGEVKSYSDSFHVVPVRWDDEAKDAELHGVNCGNLVVSSRLHLEPA